MTAGLEKAIPALQSGTCAERTALRRIAPVPKTTFCIAFLALTVSFPRYDALGCALFALAPLLLALIGRVPLAPLGRRALAALPFVLCAGIANCFFDHARIEVLPGFFAPGGVVSLLVLILKTFAAVGMVLLLTATTPFNEIAGALHHLRVPCVLILQLQLLFRYLTLVIEEARNVSNAYFLRNPECRIVPLRDWGPLVGRLFLRTVDRANAVWRAMQCRLFHAGNPLPSTAGSSWTEWLGTAASVAVLLALRVLL